MQHQRSGAAGAGAASAAASAAVYEVAADDRTGQLFVLLADGEMQVWDAAAHTLHFSEQIILPEKPARSAVERAVVP